MIYIFGISITFFLAFILLTKANKSIADIILTTWLCVIGVHLTLYYLIVSRLYELYPYFLGLEIPLPLLHGPLLFLYTITLTRQKTIAKKHLFHFIPWLVGILLLLPFYMIPSSQKLMVYEQEGKGYTQLLNLFFVSYLLSGIIYTGISIYYLWKYQRSIKEMYSDTEKINLQWLYLLISGLGVIWGLVMLSDETYIFPTVIFFVLAIGYFGIKHVGVFSNPITISDPRNSSLPEKNDPLQFIPSDKLKYENAELSESQLKIFHHQLTQLMLTEKCYQTPEITLSDIAQKLQIHPNTLSQVINRVEQKNFFDYINGLRVEEFKKRIANAEHLQFTMLSVAYDCGFNSKTSFNRNFKNHTGIAPSVYISSLSNSSK